jgi:hypothetical protein
MVNESKPTIIHITPNGFLCFDEDYPLATSEQYKLADRSVGSVFEALRPDESIRLADGYFILDDELDLVQDWSIL